MHDETKWLNMQKGQTTRHSRGHLAEMGEMALQ